MQLSFDENPFLAQFPALILSNFVMSTSSDSGPFENDLPSSAGVMRKFLPHLARGAASGMELKYLDCSWSDVDMGTSVTGSNGELDPETGCTGCISVPAQGDGESQRDGRQYVIKEVSFSGLVHVQPYPNRADPLSMTGYFLAIVLDTQANGATIVSENVFICPGGTSYAMLPEPLRNLKQINRYVVLDSKYIDPLGVYCGRDIVEPPTNSCVPQVSPTIKLHWSGDIVCNSTGDTANISSAADNAIHIIAYSSQPALFASFYGKSRIRFLG